MVPLPIFYRVASLGPGARPTNDISIEFEIWPKLGVLWFKMYFTDHNEILHSVTVLTCAKFLSDRLSVNIKFHRNIISGTSAWAKITPVPGKYRQTSNICNTTFQNLNVSGLLLQLYCPIHWSQELNRESRCSWSGTDRRCSNYIWVINNSIVY